MFKKILIANRGEIALRIIRACKELGVKTVVIHSQVDEDTFATRNADESVCVGADAASESYLNMANIVSAAQISKADAIHPGYGFLAENSHFAEVCESCDIKFIGPSKEALLSMGDKANAREIMRKEGVPIIPGSRKVVKDVEAAKAVAKKIGYPVILKAAAGGGGKGMRIVESEKTLKNLFSNAKSEAKASFGNAGLYIEKYIKKPRHIEFQIMADKYGKVLYFPERECSIQRKHQKLIEESPSPVISSKLRKRMGKAAIRAAKAIDYCTVGTVEFLVDSDDNFYFMEMNTRIQVEHPVSEEVTGIDLVKEQIRLAAGKKIKRKNINCYGHAIECRINAEDYKNNFMPAAGKVTVFTLPGGPGIRVDTAIHTDYDIPAFYDSMLAKVIARGKNRKEALARMRRALHEFDIQGIITTVDFHRKVLDNKKFIKGNVDTHFIDEEFKDV
ncbi:MAG: acetyl-CoA carboxylase biotin carboxylase subunit [Elusimicrobiota bacterium]|nr:acetyl-CoA carboxylase biotin carboxylase subunit [Elusimicrobiota bacterium]